MTSPLVVRAARPDDVPDLFEMKRKLQASHDAEYALRATAQDWLRDGFGPEARFTAFVAEASTKAVGMITCSERYYTGWAGTTLYLQDLFVDPDHRKRGIAQMLVARAAAHALDRGCPVIELTILKNNPLRRLYDRAGFQRLDSCVNYVASLEAMTILAGSLSKAFENSAEANGLRTFEAAWAKSSNNNPPVRLPAGATIP